MLVRIGQGPLLFKEMPCTSAYRFVDGLSPYGYREQTDTSSYIKAKSHYIKEKKRLTIFPLN